MRFFPNFRSAGPRCPRRTLVLSSLALAPIAMLPPHVYANLPAGAQVVHGNVAVSQAGGAMSIQQASRHAIVNWQSFDIGAGNSVQIDQGGANAAMLARVGGGDASQLLGSLKADGKLFLINTRGVIVGEGATIDTAGFLASTLDVADAEFLAGGAMTFKGDSAEGILNLGTITAREGNVMLLAHTVKNAGEINAPDGTAALAAGTEMFLASPDDAAVIVKVNLPTTAAETGVENSGTIEAAQAELKAAGGSIYHLAVNQSGIVRASGVVRRDGRVILTADGGEVKVSGSVKAQNGDGSGGEIFVGGGIRSEFGGKDPPIASATRTTVAATAQLDASAANAAGAAGRVIVWADDTTTFLGSIAARGAREGFAEVSGKRFLDFRPAGAFELGVGGELLLDPGAIFVGDVDPGESWLSFVSVATLETQLEMSDVTLTTEDELGFVEFGAALGWNSASTLRVKATESISINTDITAPNGTLILNSGRGAFIPVENGIFITPRAELAEDATIVASKLVYGTNPDALPEGWTPEGQTLPADFAGTLKVGVLEVDLAGGGTGVNALNENNAIGAFRTIGTGDLTEVAVTNGTGDLAVMLNSENSTAPMIRVMTPGTLTLESGTSLSFENQTDVVLASTGAGFINLAGAEPFGENARFLIYAASSALTSKGGLVGGDVFNHAFDFSDDFSSDTLNRFLFAGASSLPVLTYTADDLSRLFGADDPFFTATVSGLLGNDILSEVATGAPTFSTTAGQSSGVGTYAINIARGTLFSASYDFAFESGTLTIERAPLVITADDLSRRLNRGNPEFTASYDGLVNGDTSAVVTGLQFTTTADVSSPEGAYTITPSGATAANYAITFEPGTLNVTGVATLNIRADDVSRLYGAENPTFTATITGFEDGEDESVVTGLEFNTSATQRSGVGTYEIMPFGATAAGYEIDYEAGYLTIDRAPLTITAATVSRIYGDENPTFTANFSGLVNDDTAEVVSGLAFETEAGKRSNVGTYDLNVSGGVAANYEITHAAGALEVTPATLVVKADDMTRVYGDPNPTPTMTVTGLKNDDRLEDVVFLADGPSHFSSQTSGIGSYGINLRGVGTSANYNTTVLSGSLTITQRPLTIVADNKTKVYGDPNPEFTATFLGLASFDTPSVIPNVTFSTQATQTSGVSTFGILVSSGLNQNYKIGYEVGQLQIAPAELGITGLIDLSRVYGAANPALPTFEVHGLKNSDTRAMLGLGFMVPELTADAGDHTYAVTANNPNYRLVGNEENFIITPAPLTLQVTPISRLYGDMNPASIGLHVTGLAFGQAAEEVLRIDNPTDATSTVGTYNLVPELLTGNYMLSGISGNTIRINPRLLTIDVDNFARYYGDATPEFTYQLGGDGLASFDSASAVIKDVQTAVGIDERTNVGWYRIDPVFTHTPNYQVSWSSGYLAIMPRPIEIAVHNGVAFGNNSVPYSFDAEALGVDLIVLDATGFGGLGYTADVSGLPSFVSVNDVLPDLDFLLRSENEPQAIGTAVDLASIQFPARPSRTAPQDTSAPPPDSLPDTTIEFTPGAVVVPDQPTPVTFNPIVVEDSGFILGPTLPSVPAGDPTKDRFADVNHYIVPRSYQANNYVVTKVTNGVLTMKADPVIKAETLDREAAAAQRRADRHAFYMNETVAPGEIRVTGTGAFGLPRELMPTLRMAIGAFLNNEFTNGISDDPGSLANAINGGLQVTSWDQLPEEKILAWLADIHTNPAKHAIVMPVLMGYTAAIAQKNSATWSEQDKQLMAYVSPALKDARDSFIDAAKQARDNWVETDGAARSTTLISLYDGKVPYDKFVAEAVSATIADAMKNFQERAEQFDAVELGVIGGAAAGTGALTAMTLGLEKVARTLFPKIPAQIHLAMGRASQKAIDQAISKGMSRVGSITGGGAGTIVSLAVTILITESMAVADNEKAAANFNALLASRDDPVNANELMNTEQGSAIMMLGLANLFMGGGSDQRLSTNFDF